MKTIASLTFLAVTFCAAFLDTAGAQPLTVTTIAGKFGHNGYVNGVGTNAQFHGLNNYSDLAADANGFLYVVDGNSIRRISPDLLVVTLAGDPVQAGYVDATGTIARFSSPAGIAADADGNVYVADKGNYVIRKISFAGVVSTVAGDGTYGYMDSAAGTPKFQGPNSVALDSAGNIYVADYTTLRKITPAGVVSTLAGTQSPGFDDGTGTSARFISPFFMAAKADGSIYVAMAWFIRKVTPDGMVSTLAGSDHTDHDGIGTNAGFAGAYSIAVDKAGSLYVADSQAGTIRYVTPAGVVATVAGSINRLPPYPTSNDGVGTNAWISTPLGIAVDPFGDVYIVDETGYTVLKGVPPSLPAIGSFSESPGGTPVRFNNPWQFTASYSTLVSDLRLRVQSTTTTNIESSWTDLPGNLFMTDVDGTWTLDTTNVPTGTQYFRVVASAPGYFDTNSAAVGPETVLGLPQLSDVDFFLLLTGGTPVRSSNPWQFVAAYTNLVPGLQLRVQSTTTTNDEGSWQDLRGIHFMPNNAGAWTLDKTDVPTGVQYFRVVASATGYLDGFSAIVGPQTVLQGFDLWGYFSYATSVPYSTATAWGFAIGQPSQIPGMSLRVQSSTTPDDENSWINLPGGGQMIRQSDGVNWGIGTTNLPIGGAVYFRVVASAQDYVDLVSADLEPFDIGAPLPLNSTTTSTGGTRTVQDFLGIGGAFMNFIHVVGVTVHLIPADNTTTTQGAITMTAEQGGTVDLVLRKDQTLTVPGGLSALPRATLLVSGTVNGPAMSCVKRSRSAIVFFLNAFLFRFAFPVGFEVGSVFLAPTTASAVALPAIRARP